MLIATAIGRPPRCAIAVALTVLAFTAHGMGVVWLIGTACFVALAMQGKRAMWVCFVATILCILAGRHFIGEVLLASTVAVN